MVSECIGHRVSDNLVIRRVILVGKPRVHVYWCTSVVNGGGGGGG